MVGKKGWMVIVLMVVLCLVCDVCMARNGQNGKAGKSKTAHLYLYEKDPATWEIVENGSWGKMRYRMSGEMFDFVFNGHNLSIYLNYTLLYYPDPWPGDGLLSLASGRVNDEGNIHLSGMVETGDLPKDYDENYPDGSKIWLVLSEDVDCENQKMIGWQPSFYLFEYDVITYDDPNDEQVLVDDGINQTTADQAENETQDNSNQIEMQQPMSTLTSFSPMKKSSQPIGEEKVKFVKNREKLREVFSKKLEQFGFELPPGLLQIMRSMDLIR